MTPPENNLEKFGSVRDGARNVFVVAGIFSLVVAVILGVNYAHTSDADPLKSPVMAELKNEYIENQSNRDLVEQIRKLDILSRRAFFSSTSFARTGGFLLLIGLVVTLVCHQIMVFVDEKDPDPGKYEPGDDRHEVAAVKRKSVVFSALLVILTAAIAAAIFRSGLKPGMETKIPDAPPLHNTTSWTAPTDEEIADQWPGFRGPFGLGVVRRTDIPLKWDADSGLNILWKAKVPRPGFNSPVVWNDRVFLSGADANAREVYCFKGSTGTLLWSTDVGAAPGDPAELPKVTEDTGLAAPTVAVDGNGVFAIFATGDIACLSMDGALRWVRHLKDISTNYGHASSPVVYGGKVYIQIDDHDGRRLAALDAESGQTVWEKTSEMSPSWSSPVIARIGGRTQLVLNGNPHVCGYDLLTGELIWQVECMSGEVAPSPAVDGGMVFATTGYAVLAAVRIGPEGNAEIAWESHEGLPDVSSPVASDGLLFVAATDGSLACYESASGDKLWEKEFDEGFYSSPVIVNDTVFLTDLAGSTLIFRAARVYEELARNSGGESIGTTPAFADGRIYIRGKENLFCVGIEADGQ